MVNRIAIIVVCGLPGAGKTTFLEKLEESLTVSSLPVFHSCKQTAVKTTWGSKQTQTNGEIRINQIKCIHICFDNLIPNDLQLDEDPEIWKSHRNNVRRCIERDISQSAESELDSSATAEIPVDLWIKFRASNTTCRDLDTPGDTVCVYLVDDNMFYSSMRYQYYQLARTYGAGYAQIHVATSLEDAMIQNELRSEPVPQHTLVTMASKFEAPDPNSHWEALTLTLKGDELDSDEAKNQVWEMIMAAILSPVPPSQSDDSDGLAKSCDRITCSQNIIHQVDTILRKLIGQEMSRLTGCSKFDKQKKSAQYNSLRQKILVEMRDGSWRIPADLADHVTDAAKDPGNALFVYIRDEFLGHDDPS